MLRHSMRKCLNPTLLAVAISLGLVSGCSKKQEPAAAATAPDTNQQAATPAADAQPAETTAQQPTGPGLDSSQMTGDAKAAMAEADAALKQREYEKAVRTMMAIQQARLDAQQAALAHQQMVNLQRNLATAIAQGDPNAKAAADILRASHMH